MDDDCLKLGVYVAERRRTGDGFVSDELLNLYEQQRVSSSVALRGVAGFRAGGHLRTDQSLTLSEDPPVVVEAIDTRAKIETLLESVLAIEQRSLVTLERAQVLREDIEPLELTGNLGGTVKLTVHLGRKDSVFGSPAFVEICDLMYRRRFAGASAFLGVDGTARGHRQRPKIFRRDSDAAMTVVAIDSGERIRRVLPELSGLLRHPLITLQRVRVCKRDGQLLELPHALPGTDEHGRPLLQKLMVYTAQSAQHNCVPIHRGLIHQLRKRKTLDGATTLRGIWGFHGDRQPHGDKLLSLRSQMPVVTVIVDTPANIAESFDVVNELTQDQGLVTSEMVSAVMLDRTPPLLRGGRV